MNAARDRETAPIADSVPAVCAVVGADPIEAAAPPGDARQRAIGRSSAELAPDRSGG